MGSEHPGGLLDDGGDLGRLDQDGGLDRLGVRPQLQRHLVLVDDREQVAEVAVSKDGEVAVKRITCAVDCGIRINPNTIEAQVQSAIIYGLTAALFGEITLKDGRVEQSNFDNYRALRINEIPAIDVHIVNSDEAPGGMGEPGTCAVPPAVTNAIFAATGVRLRKLPIKPDLLKA